ncbi:MAG: alpha/beta fold hydrolase, partial [Chloroflexota bacterium]
MLRLEVVSHIPQTPTHTTPILFLHGAWHGAWCWEDYFLPYFAQQGFTVHAMSLRAHGLSEGREKLRWVSIDDYVTDLVQVVKALPEPPVIVAHSLGGFILQKYLEHYDTPAAVMVAPAPARGGFRFTVRALRTTPKALLSTTLTMSPYRLISPIERAHAVFFSSAMPREEVERHFKRMQDDSFRAYLDYLLLALPDTRLIRERGTPMLILAGAEDQIFPSRELEELAQLYAADVTVLPDTAHNIMLERHWQVAADRII